MMRALITPDADAERRDIVAAVRTAFEMLSADFGVTESDGSLRDMVANVVLECAQKGLCEPMEIRECARGILRSRSH
jgi:hypothetical protein